MWKALDHPNVLPLLGVIMSETQFTMVSKWMPNGNINEFVKKCPDVNRFELVSFQSRPPPSPPLVDDCVISIAGRSCEGLNLSARSWNGPWGSQRGAFSRVWVTLYL
jgi:serine/threonine protein kinase